jgi:hypothetical protein
MCAHDEHFFYSLKNDRPTTDTPIIPDGIMDCSSCIRPLRSITRNGRALKSDDLFSMAGYIGENFSESTCATAQTVYTTMLIAALQNAPKNALLEEILMRTFSQESVRHLEEAWSATPYVIDESGKCRPVFAMHSIFSKATVISEEHKKAFAARHYLSVLPYLVNETSDFDEDNTQQTNKNIRINIGDFDPSELTVDPLDGFDEMHDYFHDEVLQRYLDGDDLEELGFSDEEIDRLGRFLDE